METYFSSRSSQAREQAGTNPSILVVVFEETPTARGQEVPPPHPPPPHGTEYRERENGAAALRPGNENQVAATVWGISEGIDFLKGTLIKKQNKKKSSVKIESR